MKISEYGDWQFEQKQSDGRSLNLTSVADTSNPVQINTANLVDNVMVKKISDSLMKIYDGDYLKDLSESEVKTLQNTDLKIRSRMLKVGNWVVNVFLGSVEELLKDSMDFLTNNIIIKSFDENNKIIGAITTPIEVLHTAFIDGISWLRQDLANQVGLGAYYANSNYEYNTKTGVAGFQAQSIVIGDRDDGALGNMNSIAKKNGLTEDDVIENVFLHEFSHSIQALKTNSKPLVNTDIMSGLVMIGTKSKWASDSLLLGNSIYSANTPYSVNLEVYADVRGVLMFGKLHPEKFNAMLDSDIEWRANAFGTDHDTQLGLIKLKEYMVGRNISEMSSQEIDRVASNLASLASLAKVRQYLVDTPWVDVVVYSDSQYPHQRSMIINRLNAYNAAHPDPSDKISLVKFVSMLDSQIFDLSQTLGLDADTINYKSQRVGVDNNGNQVFRDRQGFEISASDISYEKKAHMIAENNHIIGNMSYTENERLDAQKRNEYIAADLDAMDSNKVYLDLHTGILPIGEAGIASALIGFRDKLKEERRSVMEADWQPPEDKARFTTSRNKYMDSFVRRLSLQIDHLTFTDERNSASRSLDARSVLINIENATDEQLRGLAKKLAIAQSSRFAYGSGVIPESSIANTSESDNPPSSFNKQSSNSSENAPSVDSDVSVSTSSGNLFGWKSRRETLNEKNEPSVSVPTSLKI